MSMSSRIPRKGHPAGHVFSKVGLTVFSLLIIGSFVFSSLYMPAFIRTNEIAAVVSATLVDLANNDRKTDSIGPLKINPKLVAAAQAKANDMAAKSYFSHTSPEGYNSWHWFSEVGYNFSYAGENLAVNFTDSEDVERAWMESPTHRANIMNGRFTEIGIATAEGEYQGRRTIFVVQMFGRPQTVTAFAPINESSQPENPEELAVASTRGAPRTAVLGSSVPAPAAATSSKPQTSAPIDMPPPVLGTTESVPNYSTLIDFLVSSPQNLLRTIYIFSALIVLLALGLATRMELRRHHFRHMIAAVFLLALMGGLFTVADHFVFKPPVIGFAPPSPSVLVA